MTVRSRALAVALCAMALGLSACGPMPNSATSATATTSTATAAPELVTPPGMPPADPALASAQAAADAGRWPEAIALYEQAAAQGVRGGAERLANLYLHGAPGLTADPAKAMVWAQRLAQMGDSRGLLYQGQLWMDVLGVTADADKAMACFTQADAGGDMKAARYLGLMAARRGQDATAATWFAKGAQQGDITSQFCLGRAYERGQGVAQDFAAAMRWYQQATARGDLIASDGMVGMAGLYARGAGVKADLDRAVALYRQAAQLGNADAQAALQRLGRN